MKCCTQTTKPQHSESIVGIVPGGGIFFISSAFPGIISDKSITFKNGLLNPDLWESGH